MAQRAREKLQRRRAQEESQADPSCSETPLLGRGGTCLGKGIELFQVLGNALGRPADHAVWVVLEMKHDVGSFAAAWAVSTLVGFSGVLAYALPVGRRYFNLKYLLLIPVSASLLAFLVLVAAGLASEYAHRRWGGTTSSSALQSRLGLCFFWAPLTYLVFPLKLLRPGLERHPLWVAIALSLSVAAVVARTGLPPVRRTAFGMAYVLVATPVFAAYALGPNLARVLVEFFGL